jgi:predicted negative regulator of RcsB-dependent stress response
VLLWLVVFGAVMAVSGAGYLAWDWYATGQRAHIQAASYQHVHGVQTYLEDRMQDYQALEAQIATLGTDPSSGALRNADQAQERNIVREMRNQAATISSRDVPSDVQAFLRVHVTQ